MKSNELTDLGYETFIYIKEHNKTGLRYFGKTVKPDVETYRGSGKHWKNHIKKHGYNCKTTVVFSSRFKEDLEAFCLTFSNKMNIVKSKKWANLMDENGLDGGDTSAHMPDGHYKKLGAMKSFQGKKHSDETKALMSKNNARPQLGKRGKEAANYGYVASPELRKIRSDNMKGIKKSKEHVQKIADANRGKLRTEEQKQLMSDKSRWKGQPPWRTPAAKKTIHLWLEFDEIYDVWTSNNKCGPVVLTRILELNQNSTIYTMIRWFRQNGNPLDNQDWLLFKSTIGEQK